VVRTYIYGRMILVPKWYTRLFTLPSNK